MREPVELPRSCRLLNHALTVLLAALLAGCAVPGAVPERSLLVQEVVAHERAFAQAMAERDHAAFTRFIADEAVFFTGPTPLRGKAAVAAYWKRFFETPAAPFAWQPEIVQVLDSGTLALSSGPVHDPAGQCIGRFNSIWRQESRGVWRVVFDKGEPCVER